MQSHYNYAFDNITNTYNFTTKNDILYRVAFISDATFSTISGEDIPNVFQLVIEKANDGTEPVDAKVSLTIEHIVERFFRNTENAMIYVCSDEKNKAQTRFAVFDRWYKKSAHKAFIIKIDSVIRLKVSATETHLLYTSFMLHRNNPDYEKLVHIYQQIEYSLNDDK